MNILLTDPFPLPPRPLKIKITRISRGARSEIQVSFSHSHIHTYTQREREEKRDVHSLSFFSPCTSLSLPKTSNPKQIHQLLAQSGLTLLQNKDTISQACTSSAAKIGHLEQCLASLQQQQQQQQQQQ